ncbi:magnesium-dependent phosphatase 1-like isoform X2 [Tachypleus tridentatus]|uniref:magnesium-dependent phosphatase 1-like isoform X2 n=1 Tax=Tachypleus tridentatus TaxID=6853 RepID=UPI003FD53709
MTRRPKLIVFDLDFSITDYTLWPFWVDTHVDPPFRKLSNGSVCDSTGRMIEAYPAVQEILESLKKEEIPLAVASRTWCPEGARQLLNVLEWEKYFSYQEIYPGSKVTHFKRFADMCGISYSQMLFFDDEQRNIHEIRVTCVLLPNGLTYKALEEGFQQFEIKNS